MYLDIETVPDEDRQYLWDVPEEPPVDIPPITLLAGTVPAISSHLEKYKLVLGESYFDDIIKIEKALVRPRKTVIALAEKYMFAGEEYKDSLALDPELARIVGLGMLFDNEDFAYASICRDNDCESEALADFWEVVDDNSPIIVGFNVLKFDLRVIIARSILLGVTPSRTLDLRRWGNPDIIDLMVTRFGTDRAKPLKKLLKQYGIDVMAEAQDGSMVKDMTDKQISRYLTSDLFATRDLHRVFSGGWTKLIERDVIDEKLPF
jgi:hypothetical protein